MRRSGQPHTRKGQLLRSNITVFLCALLPFALATGALVAAQQASPNLTFHVYTDLVQVPVLVLSASRGRAKPVAPNRFLVSIDDGPPLRAPHVRLEGDDPLSLAIVIDTNSPQNKLLPEIDQAIESLASSSLHPNDQVSISTLGCNLVSSRTTLVTEPAKLRSTVDLVLQPWRSRNRDPHGSTCKNKPFPLWDALVTETNRIRDLPGRRVILAITDGTDTGSRYTWNQLRLFAQAEGVAIFGLSDTPDRHGHPPRSQTSENVFNQICELSGGIVLFTNQKNLRATLDHFIAMLRERYIVEFPRPVNGTPGQHGLSIVIDQSNDIVRSAGVSVPLPDPALLGDPNTVPSDPTRKPVLGARRILTPSP